ncbi:hypothetical protein DXG01_012276, partial [Tephrocybe rancida]
KTLEASIAAGTWVGKKPSGTDMIELFTSRSMWFDSYRPNFNKIHDHPSMVEWLEDGKEPKDKKGNGKAQKVSVESDEAQEKVMEKKSKKARKTK